MNSYIGFITYGTVSYVHELQFSECQRSFAFNGIKTYTSEKMREFLSITPGQPNPFILAAPDGQQMLTSLIETLEIDPFPITKRNRAQRCTGGALDLAVTVVDAIFPNQSPYSAVCIWIDYERSWGNGLTQTR
jgi:protein transport protein SEC23